jgi:NADPH2:quinone reductase
VSKSDSDFFGERLNNFSITGFIVKAIVMTRAGEPEVLEYVQRPDPVPDAGEVLVEVIAAGVNFMDMGVRQGTIWAEKENPKTPGVEGVGRVLAIGEGHFDIQPGERVAWVYAPGSYAEKVVIPASSLVRVPAEIDDLTAASVMMQGLTASHFATNFYPVKPGDIALVHAAAGGVGLLLTQIIKLRGGQVIGRVSSASKGRSRERWERIRSSWIPKGGLPKRRFDYRAVRGCTSCMTAPGPRLSRGRSTL